MKSILDDETPFNDYTDRVPRYAPSQVLIVGHGIQPVVSARFYPIGTHPKHSCPIRSDMGLLELVTPYGSRYYGCESAHINSELRMVVVGGFTHDEIRMQWEPAKETK